MNRLLRYAWYQLIVISAATVITAAVTIVVAWFWPEKPTVLVFPLLLFGFVHFYSMCFPLKAGEIAFDERDETIRNRATRIAFTVFWYAFILSCLIPLILRFGGSISTMYLAWVLFGAGVLLRIVWSIAVIVQYHCGNCYDRQ